MKLWYCYENNFDLVNCLKRSMTSGFPGPNFENPGLEMKYVLSTFCFKDFMILVHFILNVSIFLLPFTSCITWESY